MRGELPVGWTHFSLKNLGGLSGGKTPSKANSDFWSSPDVPWVSPKDMKKDLLSDSADKISQAAMDKAGMVLYPTGSVLMVTRSGILQHTFPVALAGADMTVNQDIKVLRPIEGIVPKFSFYMLKSFGAEILSACSKDGTTVQSIDSEKLEAFLFSLPPFAEQTRIAQKLDELLVQVDTLNARINAIPALLKRFRQSVLAAAVSGRLTEEWRASRIQTVEASRLVQLSEVTLKITDGEHLTPPMIESGVPLLSAKDVQTHYLGFDQCRYVSREVAEKALSRCNPTRNDILIVSRGATVGRTHRVRTEREFCLMGSVLLIRPNPELVLPQFLEISFISVEGQRQLVATSGSSAQQAIYIRDVKSYSLELPSLEEQTEIVRRVEQLFAFADQLEAKVTSAKSRIDHLTQSILAKAFRGELVPQDPNDEPASVLLQRIQAQRAAAPKAKRGRKSA